MEVDIVDTVGLTGARSASSDELAKNLDVITDSSKIGARRLGAKDLLVIWVGFPCDRSGKLEVTPSGVKMEPGPIQNCDAITAFRGVVLTFPAAAPTHFQLTLEGS
jgi:hypothetical protein